MPQKIRKKTGQIKVSLHAAVLEETHDKLQQLSRQRDKSMGELIDELVG